MDPDLLDIRKRRFLSAETLALYRQVQEAVTRYAQGDLIDLGCGDASYRPLAPEHIKTYDTLDVQPRSAPLTFVGDIQNMTMISDARYDTVLCFEVLEHVPDPWRALAEIHRILKKGGVVILTVPHLSRLHDVPQDYYRFTEFGLRALLERAGFEVVQLQSRGGLCTFVSHQASTLLLCLLWRLPMLRSLALLLNRFLLVTPSLALDRWLDKEGTFASGYTCVARK